MTGHDPFAVARDPLEEMASALVREFLLEASPPAQVYRQDGLASGYALLVPSLSGERLLTVPGLYEADFMFHGNAGSSHEDLLRFITDAVHASRADHLRLPLLTEGQAQALATGLALRLHDWRIAAALSSVAPQAVKVVIAPSVPRSLRVALARATRAGLRLSIEPTFPDEEIRELYALRWGKNRGECFFGMLARLVADGFAELHTARMSDGSLAAAQLDILGASTRHNYFTVCDTQRAPRSGTAVLARSWQRFVESDSQRVYSFGRGAERYKYLYSNRSRELFEVRGFYQPLH